MDAQQHRELRKQESGRVAIVGALVNVILSAVKVTVGIIGNSQALIIDGIHSLSDLLTDILVLVASHQASHGPDENHPYGHGRFETAATLALGAFLVLVAGGIMWDSFERLFQAEHVNPPRAIALYAALFSILANEALYWYTIIVARRINSELLRANAWHHRSDAVSSIVVLIGVGGAMLGHGWLDLAAALIVGAMVAKIGWDLGWSAMRELVDESLEEDKVEKIRHIITDIPGVSSLHMLRTRRQGHEAMADVHVQVNPRISVSEGHMIAIAVEEEIKAEIEEISDVTVHIDPEDDETMPTCKGLPLREEAEARLKDAWKDLSCLGRQDGILLHYLGGKIDLDIFFPLDCYISREAAEKLQATMQLSLENYPEFGEVKLYFGGAAHPNGAQP
ncbi:cation diffusion facilitator family transporter [Thiolapillus brandeum]|nr:cation diffusion facilitator family transporter [Thiolapillus brandeum]